MEPNYFLNSLRRDLKEQRSFAENPIWKPDGWDAFIASSAEAVKREHPDYLQNKELVMLMIEAKALSVPEAEQLPADLLRDRDVALAFATKDPWRYDLHRLVEPFMKDPLFVAEVDVINKNRCPFWRSWESEKKPGGLDAMIADASSRASKGAQSHAPSRAGKGAQSYTATKFLPR